MAKSNVPTSPFYFVTCINEGKNPMRDDYFSEDRENDYVPFITNKAFSNHIDTILSANKMNIYNKLDKIMQFEFMLNSVRTKKRSGIWHKSVKKTDNVQKIAEYYNINTKEAEKYIAFMSEKQINEIVDMGGKA